MNIPTLCSFCHRHKENDYEDWKIDQYRIICPVCQKERENNQQVENYQTTVSY